MGKMVHVIGKELEKNIDDMNGPIKYNLTILEEKGVLYFKFAPVGFGKEDYVLFVEVLEILVECWRYLVGENFSLEPLRCANVLACRLSPGVNYDLYSLETATVHPVVKKDMISVQSVTPFVITDYASIERKFLEDGVSIETIVGIALALTKEQEFENLWINEMKAYLLHGEDADVESQYGGLHIERIKMVSHEVLDDETRGWARVNDETSLSV